MNIIEAIDDPNLFKPWFERHPESWGTWRVVLKALFGLEMTDTEHQIFEGLTGRHRRPAERVREAYLVCGRRAGKSFCTALIAVFLAVFINHRKYLQPGERGVVMVLAADKKQARVILNYVTAFLEEVPMLKKMILTKRAESIDLNNRISIEIHTASYRSVRGYTIVAAICDELAFWRSDDSANPDKEILDALRPAMATIPNSMLIGLGSPYRRSGALYEAFRDHYGNDDSEVIVVKAPSRTLNPTLPQEIVDRAYERDPVSAAAEYGAEFRSDVSGFLMEDWLTSAIDRDDLDLPPKRGVTYQMFVDPSGGRKDAFTCAIAHSEDGRRVLDLVRGRKPPFDPQAVVQEFADIAQRYWITTVQGDRYAGEWVSQSFEKAGLRYRYSEKSRSEIYLEVEPEFATGALSLPDNKTLMTELRLLERRPSRSGRDQVDHPPGGHDDYANAACGALWIAKSVRRGPIAFMLGDDDDLDEDERSDALVPNWLSIR